MNKLTVFIDSNKTTHRIEDIQWALDNVANDWEKLGYAIKKANLYADHVTEEIKMNDLQNHINTANEVRNGRVRSFTIWQRVNRYLTSECVALLP